MKKNFKDMTKAQKVWSVIGAIVTAPVAIPAAVGVTAAVGAIGVATAPVAAITSAEASLSIVSDTLEML